VDEVTHGNRAAKATAGLRGASWNVERVPAGTRVSVHTLPTADGAQITGFLYARGGERTVVSIMHPRELVVTHYLVPDVLQAGCACWVQGSRTVGNDLRLEHELAVIDVAAGQEFLRKQGFVTSVLLGNSGGAALFALYIQQSSRDPARRIELTPAGRPAGLAKAALPGIEGLILVSPHLGPGKLLQACIDPAVMTEDDPLASDDSLFLFNEANGYRTAPEESHFTPEFLAHYRQAQHARVARIDARARELVAERQRARQRAKAGGALDDRIRGAFSSIFQVWRTDADPRCSDLTLDPSDRKRGSLWGADPLVSNFGSVGFARVCTPESWLSSWSGLSSNASFEACGGSIQVPTLMVEYTGDSAVFPADADFIFASLGTSKKARYRVRGNHHGQPLAPGETSGQLLAGEIIQRWLKESTLAREGAHG